MKLDMPVPAWTGLARQPLARSLLLSISIHLALLAFVQPWTGGDGPRTLIINARLQPVAVAEQALKPPLPDVPEIPVLPDVIPHEAKKLPASQPEQLTLPTPAPIQTPEPPPAPAPSTQAKPPEGMAPPSEPLQRAASQNELAKPATSPVAIPSPIDTTWYLARQVDRHPTAIGKIVPKYPELARQRGLEGSLKLMVKIDDLGRVREVEVVEAQPPGVFDEAALEAFSNASFRPAMKDGRPVRYEAYMRVEFRLE